MGEMIRRTRAEELVLMMGGSYPLDLAVVALEQCSDNLEVAAVWLLDNAARELDRFFENALNYSMEQDIEEQKEATPETIENIYDENGRINLMLWLNEDLTNNGNKKKLNLLDDEIDAQLPVGLALSEITAHHNNI